MDRMYSASSSTDPSHPYAILHSDPEMAARDRYSNVVPFANSRIRLRVPEGQCDYINASPIELKEEGSDKTWKYIAAQGPKADGVADFWQMVYHESGPVAVVVMLTSVHENGREKCAQYFPIDSDNATFELRSPQQQQQQRRQQQQFTDPFVEEKAAIARSMRDNVSTDKSGSTQQPLGYITLLDVRWCEAAHSIIRKFKLTINGSSKTVYHYHFQNWPDHGHPEPGDRDAIVTLSKMTAEKANSPLNPRIVHCSAGVGRTGTFIALDHLLRALRSGELLKTANKKSRVSENQEESAQAVLSNEETAEKDIIYHTVDSLRRQRMYMVFTGVQYRFIHEVLREQALAMTGASLRRANSNRNGLSRGGRSPRGNVDIDVANKTDPYAHTWEKRNKAGQQQQTAKPKIIRRAGHTVVVTTDAQGHVTEYTTDRISAEKAASSKACVASVPNLKAAASNYEQTKNRSSSEGDSDTSSLRTRRLMKMPKLAGVMPPRLSISSESDNSQDSFSSSQDSGSQKGEDGNTGPPHAASKEIKPANSGSIRSSETVATQGSDGSWCGSASAGADAEAGPAMVA